MPVLHVFLDLNSKTGLSEWIVQCFPEYFHFNPPDTSSDWDKGIATLHIQCCQEFLHICFTKTVLFFHMTFAQIRVENKIRRFLIQLKLKDEQEQVQENYPVHVM